MSDESNKPVPPSAKKPSETDGSGKAQTCRPKPPLSPDTKQCIGQHCRSLAKELRSDPELSHVIELNTPGFRAELIARIRAEFRLPVGRPRYPRLDDAHRMHESGMGVRDILRVQFPNFDQRDEWEKMLLERGLNRAFSRRKARKHKRSGKTSPKNSPS
jgi:hypothetical protein